MDRWLAVVGMALAGAVVAMQPALNAGLGRATGNLTAAMLSFFVGGSALLALVALSGQLGGSEGALEVRWYYLVGGLCGAVWVSLSIVSVKWIGASGVVAATITGQLTGAILIDRLGILGLEQTPVTVTRAAGVALLALGTFMIVR